MQRDNLIGGNVKDTTPMSEQNQMMMQNRPFPTIYRICWKGSFMSQTTMAELRLVESIRNSQRKRGMEVPELHRFDVM
jgi:hypothetical protein